MKLTEKLWQLNILRWEKLCLLLIWKHLWFYTFWFFLCFLCLHRQNVDTSVLAFNKKRECFETAQIQGGLTTLSSLASLIRVWKVANSQFYTNNDLLISIKISVGVHEPMCRRTISPSKSVRWRSFPQAFGQTFRTFLRMSAACVSYLWCCNKKGDINKAEHKDIVWFFMLSGFT